MLLGPVVVRHIHVNVPMVNMYMDGIQINIADHVDMVHINLVVIIIPGVAPVHGGNTALATLPNVLTV